MLRLKILAVLASHLALQASAAEIQQTFETYCVRCHGEAISNAKVRLDATSGTQSYLEDTELAQRIVRVLSDRIMPPKGQMQPSDSLRQELVANLESVIDRNVKSSGRLAPVVMRRLNRYEYNNAVRDLLSLKGDIYPLTEKTIRTHRPYYDPAAGKMPDSILVGSRSLGKKQLENPILSSAWPWPTRKSDKVWWLIGCSPVSQRRAGSKSIWRSISRDECRPRVKA